jgi:hypothetical protein
MAKRTPPPPKMTWYKLHPRYEEKGTPHEGLVIAMPDLPNDPYSREIWRGKGYVTNPQDLMPDKKLIETEQGELKFTL